MNRRRKILRFDVLIRIFLAEKIVQSWYNQQESNTNFTQVIWKSTKEIGIGHAFSGTTLYVIILYRPRGNLLGKFTENVGCVSAVQANR